MSQTHECEGSCDPHVGEVVEVFTISETWAGMSFWYCQEAIAEDQRRGFTVTIKTPQP